MKTLTTILAAAAVLSAGAVSSADAVLKPMPSDGLFTLATTGWADDYATEGFGTAFDKTGGMPGMFTYTIGNTEGSVELNDFDSNIVEMQLAAARTLLGDNEFLAPHFLKGWDGSLVIMVAPHTLVDGEVIHGGNVNKDHFIVVGVDGSVERFDYSEDIAK